jgi:hypothetical protein
VVYAEATDLDGGPSVNLWSSPRQLTDRELLTKWVAANNFAARDNPSSPHVLWGDLFAQEPDFADVLDRYHVFEFAVDSLSADTPDLNFPAGGPTVIQALNRHGVKIAVSAAGLAEWACDGGRSPTQAGEYTANMEGQKVLPIYQAGGRISYLSLDAPLARVMQGGHPNNCNLSLDDAIHELIDYMRLVHAHDPDIRIGMVFNFPNDFYNGTPPWDGVDLRMGHGMDVRIVLDRAVQLVRAAGEEIDFLHVDNPYPWTSGHAGGVDVWTQRLLPLEQQARALNLRFGLIDNSAPDRYPAELTPAQIDARYAQETDEVIWQHFSHGGWPTDLFFESWHSAPHQILPASTPNTLMNRARASATSYSLMTQAIDPIGFLDVATRNQDVVTVAGWALDYDTPYHSLDVEIRVDGVVARVVTAAQQRPDVNQALNVPGDHGFVADIPVAPGPHQISAWAVDPWRMSKPQLYQSPRSL